MLISVTDLNNNTEPLNNYQRPEIIEEVNGAHTLALTSFFVANNPGHLLLAEESTVSLGDYDYKVKQMRTDKNRKEIVAVSTFFDMVGHRQDLIYGGTRTHTEFLTFVFGGTGWTFSTDINESRFIPNFGENSVVELLQILNDAFDCEYQIMPNKHVSFASEIGPDNDAQYRHGHNIKELSQNVDTYNLRTQITGTRSKTEATETESANGGFKVTYTSPFAEKYGIIKADPVVNDDVQTEAEMVEYLKGELVDYPETSIELDSVESSDKELGERVWVIYEPIKLADGTFMEFQTRVLKKVSAIRGGKLVTQSVVIGNAIPQTLSDILAGAKVDIEKNAKWTRSRIEQTNNMILLAVERFTGEILEAYSKITLTADEIRAEVGQIDVRLTDGVAQNKSLITQTATAIRSEVDSKVTTINGQISTANSSITQLSNQITSVVNTSIPSLDGRVNTAESRINQQANAINLKVSQSDYTGANIVGMINVAPSHIKIAAKNITLAGAVTVLSELSGNLGNIYAGNIDLQNEVKIGNRIYLRGSGEKSIIFGNDPIGNGQIYVNSGEMNVYAGYRVNFNSPVNFANSNVTGLNFAQAHTSGIGIAYSPASRNLVVRVNGSDVGFVKLS